MEREFRISAGAIVIQEDKILLVRYINSLGKSYLVGPGGVVFINEQTKQAVVREVQEETGLEVSPDKILFVEDMLSKRHRITKIWSLCNLVGGQLANTQGAKEEGIIEVGWYRRDQLNNEVVYPTVLLSHKWGAFFKDNWQTIYIGLQNTDF
jgi:ADP-ribose pyrophosphatase YjhB (NUDIX family)